MKTRRHFLKKSAKAIMYGSALSTLSAYQSACSTMDSFLSGDSQNLDNEVLIIGAGLSGLVAAYSLKQKKIPYRIYEATSRYGGRVYTTLTSGAHPKVIELGAQKFLRSHQHILKLCHDLQISYKEEILPQKFYLGNKALLVNGMNKELTQLARVLARIKRDINIDDIESNVYEQYDSLSLAELFKYMRKDVSPELLKLFEIQMKVQMGTDIEKMSSVPFVAQLNVDEKILNRSHHLYLPQGLSFITDTLYNRISGAVPQLIVKFNSPMVKIVDREDSFEIYFGERGSKRIRAKYIICTLPTKIIKNINGFVKLQLSPERRDWIESLDYGSLNTYYLITRESIEKESEIHFTDLASTSVKLSKEEIYVRSLNLLMPQQIVNDVEKIKNKKISEADFYHLDWSKKPYQSGSFSYLKTGQFEKYKKLNSIKEYGGRFIFAGEHTSSFYSGTMNGAIESGYRAAEEMSHLLIKKS